MRVRILKGTRTGLSGEVARRDRKGYWVQFGKIQSYYRAADCAIEAGENEMRKPEQLPLPQPPAEYQFERHSEPPPFEYKRGGARAQVRYENNRAIMEWLAARNLPVPECFFPSGAGRPVGTAERLAKQKGRVDVKGRDLGSDGDVDSDY